MNYTHKIWQFSLVASVVVGSLSAVNTAQASQLGTELSDSQRLKVSRIKAKNMQEIQVDDYIPGEDQYDEAQQAANAECGSVNIGNVSGSRPGVKAAQVDVIITEDIINLADDCK